MENIPRIALTGANGFVGRNLRRFLKKQKIKVISIARRNLSSFPSETKIIVNNFSKIQPSKLKNCTSLIHLIGSGRENVENDYNYVNFEITKKIVEICKKAKIKKIVFNSGLGVSENSTNSYFISKYKAEQVIINSGLDYTIFRPSYIVGKDDPLTKCIKKQIKKGIVQIPGSGNYKLQPIFVDDVAKILFKATKSKKFSRKIIDLVGPKTVSFENYISDLVGSKKIKIQKINLEQAYFEALHNPKSVYGVDDLNIMIGSFTGSSKKLEKLSDLTLQSYKQILKSSSPT
ncbi:MAG TPA: NAD-dependent epimerase/dehydratase family protein [Nitrosopumilaceae archaeon]|nr:NAD-dependent epimerase/dehydratase family protein [Nitrosopumilaceae archaeon]